jgi:uncharacterized membrane protein
MLMTLTIHLLAFSLVATGLIANNVLLVVVRGMVRRGTSADAVVLVRLTMPFAIVFLVGAGLLLLSGVGMLAERHWAMWGQLWLTVKLLLFAVMILNGRLVARPAALALVDALAAGRTEGAATPLKRLALYHVVQTTVLAAIVVLAVLKPF